MAVTVKTLLEREKMKAEIKEKGDSILLKKIESLRLLLNDYYLESLGNREEAQYKPVISLMDNRQVIEEVIMKLVKKLRDE